MRHGMNATSILSLEEEELGLRTNVKFPAFFFESLQLALQRSTRVPFEGITVRGIDIAEDASAARISRRPRQNGERLRVQDEAHVALLDAGKALHRRAVEPHAISQRVLQMADGHVDALDRPSYI